MSTVNVTTNTPRRGKAAKQQQQQQPQAPSNSSLLQLLVQFLIESELHDHPTYLVDAMWDLHPMLKDWQAMTDLVLKERSNTTAAAAGNNEDEEMLDDLHERYIVELMTCCVRQAATGEYPVARRGAQHSAGGGGAATSSGTTGGHKMTARELKQLQDDRAALSEHFIVALPDLLDKYVADAEKLVCLLQIPTHFELAQYTLRRQEKSLDRLLKLIQDIVGKHNSAEVLDACSRCLAHLCDEEASVYVKCNLMRSTILDELCAAFNAAMRSFDQLSEVDEAEMYPLIVALKRLAAFAENHNIAGYELANNTFTILKWAVHNDGFGHDFVNKALNLARSIITWNLHKLNALDERGQFNSRHFHL